jgi:mono/diheme cytochrome c family protein
MSPRALCLAITGLLLLPTLPRLAAVPLPPEVTNRKAVKTAPTTAMQIFKQHCFLCHGDKRQKGGVDLRTVKSMRRGGENGPVLVSGSLKKSLLWEVIETDQMPPADPLTELEKQTIRDWIETMPR